MAKQKYLTIQEYADLKGVTYQSAHKRLKTGLKDFVVEVEGKKLLKYEVLKAEGIQPKIKPGLKNNTTVENSETEILRAEIDRLRAEISDLREENRNHVQFIKDQSRRLADLTEQSHVLLQQNQKLLELTERESSSEVEKESVIEVGPLHEPEEKESIEEEHPEPGEAGEQPAKKKWYQFWK